MSRRLYLRSALGIAALFSSAFAAVAILSPQPRLIWNASASAPTGLYRIDVGARPALGDFVAIMPPPRVARYLAARGYLPRGVPLIKRVAALPGQTACRFDVYLSVGGRVIAEAKLRDRTLRQLPVWHGCRRIGAGEYLLVNSAENSLDSRYFGPFPASGLIGVAQPLIVREAPGAPLRMSHLKHASPQFLEK